MQNHSRKYRRNYRISKITFYKFQCNSVWVRVISELGENERELDIHSVSAYNPTDNPLIINHLYNAEI